LPRRA